MHSEACREAHRASWEESDWVAHQHYLQSYWNWKAFPSTPCPRAYILNTCTTHAHDWSCACVHY